MSSEKCLYDSLPYVIEGFDTRLGQGPGNYGCTITITGKVAAGIIALGARNEQIDAFKRLGETVKGSVPKHDTGFARVEFFEDTWLLSSITVGGDCACLFIDGNDKSNLRSEIGERRRIAWHSHNIDNPEQAGILISVWLLWFNTIARTVEIE